MDAIRRRLGPMILVATLASLALTGCVSGRGGATPAALPRALQARLLATAREAAGENHGQVDRAVAVLGRPSMVTATLAGATERWVVEVSGRFTCGNDCSYLQAAPRGTVMTLYLDPRTLAPTGFSLGSRWRALSALGTVHVLRAGAPPSSPSGGTRS